MAPLREPWQAWDEACVKSPICLALAWAAVLQLAACRSAPEPEPVAIVTAQNLIAALRRAAPSVDELGTTQREGFRVAGQQLEVGQAVIEVYEYADEGQRQDVMQAMAADLSSVGGFPLRWEDRPHLWSVGRLIVVYQGTDGGTILLLSGLLGDAQSPSASGGEEPYPPGVVAAVGHLAQTLAVDPATVMVLEYEAAEWPNSCLGLPEREEMCAEVITPGWRVRLQVEGASFVLRTDLAGDVIRQESPGSGG